MGGDGDARGVFSVRVAILFLGVAGITAQTVLLRELLVQYHGNEFSVGVIIGNWVAASALGAFLAGRRSWRSYPAGTFVLLTTLFSLAFPLSIALCRLFKPFAGIQPGMGLTFVQLYLSSLLLLLLPAALMGGLFIVATRLYAHLSADAAGAPGKTYALDSAGTMLGGLIVTFFLLPLFSPMQVSALLLLAGGAVSLALPGVRGKEGCTASRAAALFMLLASLVLFSGGAGWIERETTARQWQGREVVSSRNSPYQNISVVRDGEQLTVYADGLPFTTLPNPDTAAIEELAHIPALSHPDPRSVLVVGGGGGGIPAELLKHPSMERVDILELDPLLLDTVRSLAPGNPALSGDVRVRPHLVDGRRFLRQGGERYDLVLLNMPLPLSLQANRYFSREFFRLVSGRLNPDGLVAFAAPGSTAYYSPELREMTAILTATAGSLFPRVHVIPGESNIFLAFAGSGADLPSSLLLSQRLRERGISAALITPEHLSWRLDPSQSVWFAESMAGARALPNRDFVPGLLSVNLAQSSSILNPWIKPLLTGIGRIGPAGLSAFALVAVALFCLLGLKGSTVAMPVLIAASGMTAMLLELILVFVFQICSGVMFQAIALLIALFMGGLCCGSLVSAGRPESDYCRLLAGEAGLLILSTTLLCLFLGTGLSAAPPDLVAGSTLPLLFAAGFFAGMQFPPAVRMLQRGIGDGEVAGVGRIYAADLLGGMFGGVFGGMLLPFLGFAGSCAILVSLKLAGLLLLQIQRKKGKI